MIYSGMIYFLTDPSLEAKTGGRSNGDIKQKKRPFVLKGLRLLQQRTSYFRFAFFAGFFFATFLAFFFAILFSSTCLIPSH
jgi:hypothetical protein